MGSVEEKPDYVLTTVISHEDGTITRFSLTMLHRSLGSWSPWVPLNRIGTASVRAERF